MKAPCRSRSDRSTRSEPRSHNVKSVPSPSRQLRLPSGLLDAEPHSFLSGGFTIYRLKTLGVRVGYFSYKFIFCSLHQSSRDRHIRLASTQCLSATEIPTDTLHCRHAHPPSFLPHCLVPLFDMVLVPKPRLQVDNVVDNEVVHQRCLLLKGITWGSPSAADDNSSAESVLLVKSRDAFTESPSQEKWPVMNDAFRCLVMLQPGPNELQLEIHHGTKLYSSVMFTVQYQPLLQLPPLHLAIIIAKDSAYPPSQEDADPDACSELDTAITKFRTTAYMWQAYIAETIRSGGLGRRSFRLDEPWTARMDSLAQVHVVRSERTAAELRDIDYRPGERSSSDRDALLQPFEWELATYGAPFIGAAQPVVAAMVLDADWTYAADQEGTLADVPLAWCRSNGPEISFCLFSSRLACAWPRSPQEASACLLDARPMGPAAPVAEYRDRTREEACGDGQTTVLHRLTNVWGCVNTLHVSSGDNWKHAFVPTAEPRDTQWRLPEGLRLRARDHFQLPGDRPAGNPQAEDEGDSDKESDVEYDEDLYGDNMDEHDISTHCLIDDQDHKTLVITYPRGLAQVCLIRGGNTVWERNYQGQAAPPAVVRIDEDDVADTLLGGTGPISRLRITGMDGHWQEDDVPDLFGSVRAPRAHRSTIPVPGTSLVLIRHTVRIPELDDNKNNDDDDEEEGDVFWAALLQRWHRQGDRRLAYAKCIRVAVSNMELSGGSIAYSDGTERRMGQPDEDDGNDETRARVLRRRRDVFAVRQVALQVGRAPYTQGQLVGCQIVLGNGHNDDDDDTDGGTVAWGDLVCDGAQYPALVLRPAADERVVGFCGRSDRRSRIASEFGILCAPRAVVDGPDGLPREVYDMPEFMGLEDWSYDSSECDEDGDDNGDDNDKMDEE